MAVSLATLPIDVYPNIAVFQNAGGMLQVSQTCTALNKLMRPTIMKMANEEQERLNIQFLHIPLTAERIISEWRDLSDDTCRTIKERLTKLPLRFYAGRFDALVYLLDEDALAARTNPNKKIPLLVLNEKNIPKAQILAESISCAPIRHETLSSLALREDVDTDTALKIVDRLPGLFWKSYVLRSLALRGGLSLVKSISIGIKIPHNKMSRETVKKLVDNYFDNRKNVSANRARSRSKTFVLVAHNEPTVRKSLEIISLVSNQFWKNYLLRLLAMKVGLPLSESVAIAISIPRDKLSRLTVNELVDRYFERRKALTSDLADPNGKTRTRSASETKSN